METAGDPGDVQVRQCGTCDGASASCWCVNCNEALCDACLAAHRRVTLTRSHRVLNRQPEGPSLVFPIKFCRIHPSEELKLFCFSCCQLTCRDCQLADHQSHRFDFVSKAVASVKKQLDACMQPFRAQMDASRKSLQDMEARLEVLARCESFMTSKLQKHVDMLIELLKKRFDDITRQIQVVYNVERNLISRKMETVKQLQQSHVSLTEAAEKARNTTNLPTLVGCISQITSQMKDLVDEDSRPPSKMIDVKVTTNRNSVEGILNFGKLQVAWIPFSSPPSSSTMRPAPPTSTCQPLTCSTATTNSGSVGVAAPPAGSTSTFIRTGSGTAASSAPSVSISCSTPPPYPSSSGDAMMDFIVNNKAVLPLKSSSVSNLDPSCGSWGPAQIPRVPSSNNSFPVPASTSLPVSGSTSLPVLSSTSLPVPASTSIPVPASISLSVPGSTSLSVPGSTSLSVSGLTSLPVPTFTSVPVHASTSLRFLLQPHFLFMLSLHFLFMLLPHFLFTLLPHFLFMLSPHFLFMLSPHFLFLLPPYFLFLLPPHFLFLLSVPASVSLPVHASTSLPVSASTSLPFPASTSLSVPDFTSVPASVSLPVSASTSLPVSASTSLPVSASTSLPVPASTSLPVPASTSLSVPAFTSVPASVSLPVHASTSLPVSASTSLPFPASTSLSVPDFTSVPASVSLPVSASTSLPVSASTSLSVSASTSLPVPASTSLPVPASTSLSVPGSTSLPVSGSTSLPVLASTSLPVPVFTSVPASVSLPVSASTSLPVPAFTSVPASTSLPVSASTSLPVSASTSLPVPASTSLSVPGSTSLPVLASTSLPVPVFTSVPASASLPVHASASSPPVASTSLPVPAPVKFRAAQDIEARNPFLWSLLSQSSSSSPASPSPASPSPASPSPASPSPPSSGPVHGQSSSSCSSSSLTSDVQLQTTTTKGPERVADRSEGAKPPGKRDMGPSRGQDSAVRINVLTKSQLESSSDKLFVKFQWMKKKNSKSSKSSSSLLPSSPKRKRSLSGKQQLQRIQNQPGSPVGKLNRQAGGVESSPSVPPFSSTNLVFPKVDSTAASPANIQPMVPATAIGSGSPSAVSAGPQTLPGNDPSVWWSPELQNLPESNNLQLLECLISEVGRPSSALKDQQQNPASRQTGKRKKPNRLEQGSSAGVDPPSECRSSDPTRTGASDQDLIVVLSDDESLPDVYEVPPSVEDVQSVLPPVTVGGSDDEISIVEPKPPGDESKAKTFTFIERDIFDEPASPAASEDRMSTALSEVPELGLKLSSSETSDSDDEDLQSIRTEQQDYSQLRWQPTVSLLRLPLSLPGHGRLLPRYHFILGEKQDELYLQEMEENDQSSNEDISEIITDHDSDVTEDFTILHSTESPLSLEVISCAACGASSASKICTVCGRGYHRDCHVPPFGPDIWSELVCSLCQDLSDLSDPYSSDRPKSPHGSSLSLHDQRRCETLLLHLKVKGCRHFSQLDLWSDLMLVSERLSHHLSPPYQTPAQVVSDLWGLFSDASQDDALLELQQSFQKRLVETLGSQLPPSLLAAPPRRGAPLHPGENLLSDSQVKVLKKRLKDLLKGPAAAKRPKNVNPEDQKHQM
ncbi:LOW QUALITY PROTEIN: mucin-5AC-like [Poeciliopsis prolifica]|uniref:LOW QUALITY PROTEIN: mucin-5AC-like n=1 Tax=Poeciliopsis prolifica TaxID=188132 RepID=UPI002413CE62|nr:LOW QUALITY PROTEIN: mucin-5AC-like [Poeciliopsis prolifica]